MESTPPKLVLVSDASPSGRAQRSKKTADVSAAAADEYLAKAKAWDPAVEQETDATALPALAAKVYLAMKTSQANQSVIFRGVNAADKNSAIQRFISYIITLSAKKTHKAHAKILAAMSVLAAFGNVRTSACGNANRFGHFSEIHFDERQKVVGFKTLEYLLEKERVTDVPAGERSFHVFYYLLAGASPEQRSQFKLHDLSHFDMLKSGQRTLDKSDSEGFGRLVSSLKTLGLSKKSQHQLFQLLAAMLHLGNIQFVDTRRHDAEEQCTQIKNHDQLQFAAGLLGLQPEQLQQSLLSRTTVVGRDLCTTDLDSVQAAQHRNALAQTLYALLFTWLVEYINSRVSSDHVASIISVTEFPGAELNLASDRRQPTFWNFCANLIEERLNAFALDHVRRFEVEQFGAEGIQVPALAVDGNNNNSNNRELVDALYASPQSLIALLNEESTARKADVGRLMKSVARMGSYRVQALPESGAVSVQHTVTPEPVVYPLASYVADNLNSISSDFIALFRGGDAQPPSDNEFACGLFSRKVIGAESATSRKQVVGGHVPGKPLRRPTLKRRQDRKAGMRDSPSDATMVVAESGDASASRTVLSEMIAALKELFEETLSDTPTWFVFCTADTAAPPAVQQELFQIPELRRHLSALPNGGNHFVRIPYAKLMSRYALPLAVYNIDEPRAPADRINGLFGTVGVPLGDRVLGRDAAFISWRAFAVLERDLKKVREQRKMQGRGTEAGGDDNNNSEYDDVPAHARGNTRNSSAAAGMRRPKPAFMTWDDAASYVSEDETAASDSQSVYDAFSLQNGFYSARSVSGDLGVGSPPGGHIGSSSNLAAGAHLEKVRVQDEATGKDALELVEVKPGQPPKVRYEKPASTPARKRWVVFVWLLTFWVPPFVLSLCGRMKDKHIQMAWREKLVLCFLIFLLSAVVLFVIIGVPLIVCPNRDAFSSAEVLGVSDGNKVSYVSAYGYVLDLNKLGNSLSSTFHSKASFADNGLVGRDISSGFRQRAQPYCSYIQSDIYLMDMSENTTGVSKAINGPHQPLIKRDATLQQKMDNLLMAKTFRKGILVWDPEELAREWVPKDLSSVGAKRFIINKSVYDLSSYFASAEYYRGNKDYQFFKVGGDPNNPEAQDLDTFLRQRDAVDLDLTNEPGFMQTWNSNPHLRECFNAIFLRGFVDERKSTKCLVADYIPLAMSVVLFTIILAKFLAALQMGGGRETPEKMDKFVMIQVPCYTEGEESMTNTINSLATMKYDDKRKLMVIICDGMIVGRGNDKPTPQIVLDILGVDPTLDPEPLSYQAVGEGSRQHNMAKVYSGLYEFEGHLVPYLVIVKVGKPSETQRPGNRGKRDSQMVLMRFLNKLHYDYAMSPLELEMRHHIQNIIGVDPKWYEYMLMVDADTTVYPDSLSKLVSLCMTDTNIVGCCGETRLLNEKNTMITMIQVYEYFISHHLSKAFESLFGSVTCLPGCFCMYRIYSPIKNKPLLAHDNIVRDYSDCKVNTLHKKNLLSLGEDRYLTTLVMKYFPHMKTKFTPSALANTFAPESFSVLLSQRRRWINSTFHNLIELVWLKELCGFCCFSMRFVVFIDLIATIIMPATVVYLVYLIYLTVHAATTYHSLNVVMLSLILFAVLYGFQAVVFIAKKEFSHVIWMLIYLLALPVFGFFIPIYSFWHFDDFSWGNTRKIIGNAGEKVEVREEDEYFDISQIKHMKWSEWEAEYMETRSVVSEQSHHSGASRRSAPAPNRFSTASGAAYDDHARQSGYFNGQSLDRQPSHRSSAMYSAAPTAKPQHRMSMLSGAGGNDMYGNNSGMRSSFYGSASGLSPVPSPVTLTGIPTDEELAFEIRRILSTADLMKITKKQVREELSALFAMDLTARKEFINMTIDLVLEEYAA
ncbi:hypothetical protein RI367_005725 [Sorochytrium milnesiophthora]